MNSSIGLYFVPCTSFHDIAHVVNQLPLDGEARVMFTALRHYLQYEKAHPHGTTFVNYLPHWLVAQRINHNPEVIYNLIQVYGNPVPIDGKRLLTGYSHVWVY